MSKRLMIVVSLAALAASLSAQSFFIRGVVRDETGAVIPGVRITIVSRATGTQLQSITADNGTFAIPALNAGEWELTAELPGFATWKTTVTLGEKQVVQIDITLRVGSVAQSVEVTVGALPLLTSSTSLSTGGFQGPRRTDIVDRGRRKMNTESYS